MTQRKLPVSASLKDADRLARIRFQMKILKHEEQSIRDRIIASGATLVEGDEYVIEVVATQKRYLDTPAVKAWVGKAALAMLTKVVAGHTLKIYSKDNPDDAT